MSKHYFVNKQTGRRYEIIKIESTDHVDYVTLKGEYNQFTAPFDKAAIKGMGYMLEKVEA